MIIKESAWPGAQTLSSIPQEKIKEIMSLNYEDAENDFFDELLEFLQNKTRKEVK
jgi:hypothetical protein